MLFTKAIVLLLKENVNLKKMPYLAVFFDIEDFSLVFLLNAD
ncbi:hypothetical protein B14911_13777 [Bacillus sp. NRRL B-14911]|uniref:Uncharacterized protein n=1 Tax=Bacillus infantis NRRL B-14911 TaxID=1367477 RepID=U5LHG2_9BACI|nr:hypothetical protein N288_25440 [Bacillus infantis NRRL B-14911]EAR67838.1 hypothetical protein B14911_13777 [Bacillus sp. NRRL B-14911]